MRERLFSGDKELLTLMGILALESTPKEEGRGKRVSKEKEDQETWMLPGLRGESL